jgi:methylase of polypeptide subunit release factors
MIKNLLKRALLRILNNHIRKNRLITRFLFGLQPGFNDRIQWDFTTLILPSCLKGRVAASDKVLEIGTGPFALLSQWLFHRYGCTVHASDINGNYVESARKCICLNNSDVTVFQSDLFENIAGIYDVVFFNAVYIPAERGKRDGIDGLHAYTTDWCGGPEGHETIARFLSGSKAHVAPLGKVLLGFNGKYLRDETVERLCLQTGFTIIGRHGFPMYPSKVFVLTLA